MMTERLSFTPVSQDMRVAMHSSRETFAELVGLRLPAGWPEFPEAFAGEREASPPPWSGYLFADRATPTLIGNGGFVSPPDRDGVVEIGYEIAPEFRGRGLATEAARALMDIALGAGAKAVIAHSLPVPNASNAVMRKLGMAFVAELGAGEERVWRWKRTLPT
jgi:RimJ/RimL family protein N-acetyltransferase